jgi:type I restriction enzyme S subunit
MDERFNYLPKNWILTKIEDICTNPQYGYTTKASKNGNLKLLRTTDITSGKIKWETVPYCSKNPDDINKYILEEGDILISRAGSVGVSYLLKNTDRAVFASYLIRFKPLINTMYFKYFLDSPFYWNSISEKKLGIAVPNVNATKLKSIEIPLPPLNEQDRIVEKIEELFSGLDKATEELQKVREQLKVYRQSVLKAAFEGNLTKHEKIIQKYITNFGKAIEIVSGQTPKGINSVSNNGKIPFYKISDMNINGNEKYMKESRIKLATENIKKYKIKVYPKGTVIFPKRGGAILTNKKRILYQDASFDLNTMGVIPNDKIISKYLYYWFLKIDLGTIYDGSSVPQINRKDIVNIKIPTPDISIQNQIVQEIESRLSVCDKIEESVESGLKKIEHLRQSILRKAFEGKLVSQWTDLPAPQPGKYWVYIVKCNNDSNYIGFTSNLRKRWEQHLNGGGADWTKRYKPKYLMYWEEFDNQEDAIIREKKLKTGYGRKWIKREEEKGRLWRAGETAEELIEQIKIEKEKTKNNSKKKVKA